MKTVYIDSEFKCHTADDGTMKAVETEFYDGKCDAIIDGYCFVPAGESWTREDGAVFHGELAFPWKPWEELDKAQREYERQILAEYAEALKTLVVTV